MDQGNRSFKLNLLRNSADDDQIIMGVTEVTVTILDDDPATPTNLELASQTTDKDLGHVAVSSGTTPTPKATCSRAVTAPAIRGTA